jgi:hypothetical protein
MHKSSEQEIHLRKLSTGKIKKRTRRRSRDILKFIYNQLIFFAMLGIKLRFLRMLGKGSTTEINLQSCLFVCL